MINFKRSIASSVTVLALMASVSTTITTNIPILKNISIVSEIEANAASGRLYNQNDSQWKNVKFSNYSRSQNSMYESGCGIFSFANAIYGLNGIKADAKEIASWAVNNGSYRPGSGGLYRDAFYNNIQNAYGSKLKFKIDGKYYGNAKDSRLINHLRNGGVAVAHVSNHFIAVTGYNNGNYHVIESAVWSGRGLSADSWVKTSKLISGNTRIDWFVLISNNGNSSYFPKYSGKSVSIVDALNSLGIPSSFSYRKEIARANGLTTYGGLAKDNLLLLGLLKKGELKRP